MNKSSVLVWALLVFGCLLDYSVYAADLSGVWVSNPDVCDKVFVKKGSNVSFAKDADMYGSGFIIEGNRVRGKIAKCTIKSTKEDTNEERTMVHMVAACATDIMLSNIQVSFRIVNQDRIVRMFPGISELGVSYSRCLLK
jgi:hypothetical protein